jgi:hypothetical protein
LRAFVVAAILLAAGGVRAGELPRACTSDAADGDHPDPRCFELDYEGTFSRLGVTATATVVEGAREHVVEGGFLTSFATETFLARRAFAGHYLLRGALGGGSAGNEGTLETGFDFGFRHALTPTSGPFFRVGATGFLLGHRELHLSWLEPLHARFGLQWLRGGALLESGLTGGFVLVGRHSVRVAGLRDLAASPELGGYVALELVPVSVRASATYLTPEDGAPLKLARAIVCGLPWPLAVCADLTYVETAFDRGRRSERHLQSLYTGLTVGLTP